jgi:hypothetical protein
MLTAAWLLVGAGVSYGQPSSAPSDLPVLTSIEQVRRLTPEEARRSYPVHLKAVVTYFDPADPELFLQDSSGGIWVRWTPDMPKTAPGFPLQVLATNPFSNRTLRAFHCNPLREFILLQLKLCFPRQF